MDKQVKHGGKRQGAGKPAQYNKPMRKVEFMLPEEAIEFYTLLGDGNRSEGARRAWRSLTQRGADLSKRGRNLPAIVNQSESDSPA